MQLEKLEKLKKRFKDSQKVDMLSNYLNQQMVQGIETFVPEIISNRLKIPFTQAIYLLGLAEEVHLLKRGYIVYTMEGKDPLGEYPSTGSIPQKIRNPGNDQYVDRDNFIVDLVYHPVTE